MTNKQRAAARRAMGQYPGLRVEVAGETIIPVRIGDGARATPVEVVEAMSAGQVEAAVKAACRAISG